MGTLGLYVNIEESVAYIKRYTSLQYDLAIVLGTGMNGIVDLIEDPVVIDYGDIPHFAVSTVRSHEGKMYLGKVGLRNVVIMAGRFHYYEGYDMDASTYYIHVLYALGVRKAILTSASGGVNPHYKEGDLAIIKDHINLFSMHPLRGLNDEKLGPRFPDMLDAYPAYLRATAIEVAQQLGYPLHESVYLGWQGPSLETPAEYRMIHILGGDLVGMSTIPEVIVNQYRGIETLALTIVSNTCFPPSVLKKTTIQDVIGVMEGSAPKLDKIIRELVGRL